MRKDKPIKETDTSLVARIQAGEIEAFDVLFERHRRGVFAYVRGMVGDSGVAEDLTQEAFARFVRDIQKIHAKKGASPWIYRVARNLAIDTIRHRKFEVLPGDEFFQRESRHQATDKSAAPDEAVMAQELQADIRALVQRLPEAERELVTLRFYAGLTFREIAETLDRPIGTVLWQVREVLKKLKKMIG